jgi:hypothetical protein
MVLWLSTYFNDTALLILVLVFSGFWQKKPNRTKTGRLESVSFFFFVFFQNFGSVVFIDKNRTELKMTTPSSGNLSGPVSIHVKNLLTWAPNPQKTSLFYYSIVFEFLGPTPLVSKLICTKIIALFVYSANHGAWVNKLSFLLLSFKAWMSWHVGITKETSRYL